MGTLPRMNAAKAEAADARAARPPDRVNRVFNADRPDQAQGWVNPAPSFGAGERELPLAGRKWHSGVSHADLPFRAVTCPW